MTTPTTEQEDLGADIASETSTPGAPSALHTPGPWFLRATPCGHEIRMGDAITSHNDHESHNLIDYNHLVEADDGDGAQYVQAEANARLIVAAPDLLEALRETLSLARDYSASLCGEFGSPEPEPDTAIMAKAHAAIAKATGADGAPRHGTAAVSSGPTPQSLKAQP